MGFRFRKSKKILPGVRLNFSNKSVGVSLGGKRARVSVSSSGRKTYSASIPGTGISYVKTSREVVIQLRNLPVPEERKVQVLDGQYSG